MTGPLDGITVLDLTRLAPGPYCTMILGDLGADVIRIHNPAPPEGRRAEQAGAAPDRPLIEWRGTEADALDRNKRSIGLNLKNQRARELFYTLVKDADVVVEEMRPGVVKRLGVDYETLYKINKRIVYCSVTGFGQTGPYKLLAGHDLNYIGHAGALSLIGDENGQPVIPQNIIADYAGGGLMAAMGVLAALYEREKSGEGQLVDAAMSDGVTYLLAQFISAYYGKNELPQRGRSTYTGQLPQYNVYETADKKWITIGSLEPWFYANLCRKIGRDDLIPHAWDNDRHPEIHTAFTEAFKAKKRDEIFEWLNEKDLCANRMLELDEIENDEQIQAREMIVEVPGANGPVKQVGVAPKLSRTPSSARTVAPTPGAHTNEILSAIGYSEQQISELRDDGAIE